MPHTRSRAEEIVEDRGLLFAVQMDGKGGGSLVGWNDIQSWERTHGPLWAHVDAGSAEVRRWLTEESGLTPVTIDALLDPSARPRVFAGRNGFATILRGVNLNPGAEREDMVAMRIWSDGDRVITLRHDYLRTPRIILDSILAGQGPTSAPALYEGLIDRLIDFFGGAIEDYEARIDRMETDVADDPDVDVMRRELTDIRQDLAQVRRYMSPQRHALQRLLDAPPVWLEEKQLLLLRESVDQFEHYVEELDEYRERALVVKDDIQNLMDEKMNRNMYILSIVAAVFLPLGFLTGLLGINVGGMPGVESGEAFWITCGVLAIVLVAEVALFRRLGWL
ncbi:MULTISPECIES: zinc transporter ZntB [Pacificimonas]|nr:MULTISPECIES: zinc transporter ZntB [Pacificimonas]MBZ6378645.1 zinc transporter ZntB [Pacificimonas aurantium]